MLTTMLAIPSAAAFSMIVTAFLNNQQQQKCNQQIRALPMIRMRMIIEINIVIHILIIRILIRIVRIRVVRLSDPAHFPSKALLLTAPAYWLFFTAFFRHAH
ncbi:hypothetical protein [Paenibacillus sp. MBLB4367]|uniref:hypothetical protein n=1 Tax=Paenibacillus sp. MBLB4367 TaxID=3384767 RepID=UPI003907F733